jgi:hypothetical protein
MSSVFRGLNRLRPVLTGVTTGAVAGGFAFGACRADGATGRWGGLTTGGAAAAPEGAPKIVVVGSTNVDLVAYCPKLPRPGETLMGTNFIQCFGGKGANQAVLAAKLGGSVTMVAKVGADGMGAECIENYKSVGVDTNYVFTVSPSLRRWAGPVALVRGSHGGGAGGARCPHWRGAHHGRRDG